MSQPWPPPPDLHSIQELVREADLEGLIADGAPADEYDPEALAILMAIQPLTTEEIREDTLAPIIEAIWLKAFSTVAAREDGIAALARQIARFFGPEAKPITRTDLAP